MSAEDDLGRVIRVLATSDPLQEGHHIGQPFRMNPIFGLFQEDDLGRCWVVRERDKKQDQANARGGLIGGNGKTSVENQL